MPGKIGREFVAKDYAVRVSDGGCAILKGGAADVHAFSQHLSFVSDNRYLRAQETHFPHFNSHCLSATVDLTDHCSAKSFYGEWVLMHQTVIPEIARKDAKAIPALLRFAAVRVQDSEAEITGVTAKRAEKYSIGPNAIVTVTNEPHLPWVKVLADILWTDHYVIISEAVVLDVFHFLPSNGEHEPRRGMRRSVPCAGSASLSSVFPVVWVPV